MTLVSSLAPHARHSMQPPPPPHPVTQYALDVVAGRVVAGILVRKACERHLSDLSGGAARGLSFDEAAATKAISFFGLLRHYKGDLGKAAEDDDGKRRHLGAFIDLQPWQCFIVGSAFGWKRHNGLRRFRRIYVEVAKKNGKTLLAAGLGLLLAFFDGEPGAEVYSLATKEEQAKLSWKDGATFVAGNPQIKDRVRRVGNRLVNEQTHSFWMPLGRDSDVGDQGINAHGAIIDELHVLANRETIDNIQTATASRSQPMIIKITTAGVRGAIVWEDERADAVSVVEGRATDDSMLVLIYTLDEGDDPFNPAVWRKANPNLDVSLSSDFLQTAADLASRSPAFLGGFLRYHVNIPTNVSTRAIDVDLWDRWIDADGQVHPQTDYRVEPETGTGCFGGMDLASTDDLTAFVLFFQAPDGLYDALCWFWCPEEGVEQRTRRTGFPYADWVRDGYLVATPGPYIDYAFLKATIIELATTYAVGEVGYDQFGAMQLGVELAQEGIPMVKIPQTTAGLGPAWRELDKLILEGKLRHGGNPILRWMAGNVEVVTDPQGNMKPDKAHAKEKIDGMIALDMALGRWMVNGGAPAIWTAA